MVLLYHGWFQHLFALDSPLYWLAYPGFQGFTGVHLFLLLSGFCIHARVASGGSTGGFFTFWRRRLTRLYPPYLASVALSYLVLLRPGWAALAIHLIFLFPFFPTRLWNTGNLVYWTLALEEQLYLLYWPLLWLRRRLPMRAVLSLTLVVTLAWRAVAVFALGSRPPMWLTPAEYEGALAAQSGWAWLTLAPARWFEWVLGAALAEQYFRGHVVLRPFLTLAALVVALAGQRSPLGWVVTDPAWGVFYLGLFAWVLQKNWHWRPLAAVGIFSYSLYLVHVPFLSLVQPLLTLVLPDSLAYPLGCALVLPPAYLFYLLVERPAIRASKRAPGKEKASRDREGLPT